jgi:hypothetical protein
MRERQGWRTRRKPAHQEVVGGGRGGRARGIICLTLPPRGVYIVGKGGTLTPPPSHLWQWPGEDPRAAAARARGAPRQTLTLPGLG